MASDLFNNVLLNMSRHSSFSRESFVRCARKKGKGHIIKTLYMGSESGRKQFKKTIQFMKTIQSKLSIENFDIEYTNSIHYLKKTKHKQDLIFADPPYNYKQTDYNEIINIIFEKYILNTHGTLILEHSKLINFDTHKYLHMKKRYGSVNFSFLKNEK